ncbi:hypothetical protein [Hydrogenophaga crocea]|uniref:Uncharacterized protein n=1 Tax=Hydrogenophaga crocea TaxID=2716225 RepID=A0A6G8IK34_9BURK|nr:hypothetical protein [Hydrogenophaga crocea]QIM53443.1 hypothetical protein G9Q37_15395 [Hydrogenophaga crocea]
MHSSGRVRSLSSPTRLTHDSHVDASPLRADTAAQTWREALNTARGRLNEDLLQALDRCAHGDRGDLDLSEHREPIARAGADGTLERVLAACTGLRAARGYPLQTLVLPAGLRQLPGWLRHVDTVTTLRVPHYRGRQLDARGLPGLRSLDLGAMVPRELELLLPKECAWSVQHPDGRKPASTETSGAQHRAVGLRFRPLNFNGLVARQDKADDPYVCRHLSMEKVRLWGRPRFLDDAPEDPMASITGIQRTVTPDTEQLCADLDDRARQTHLVDRTLWRPFVEEQFRQMALEGRTTVVAMFQTETHSMALRFDASDPNNPGVECWDPNFTNVSTFSRAPFDFNALFWDFERVQPLYFREQKGFGVPPLVRVTPIDDPLFPEHSVVRRAADRSVSMAFANLPHSWHPHVVQTLVKHGLEPPGLQGLIGFIEHTKPTPAQCRHLLTAADSHHFPALNMAAALGHGQAFAMMEPVLERAFQLKLLTEKDVLAILEARSTLGTAMNEAFRKGHADVVASLGGTAKRLWHKGALSQRSVYHLMRAANHERASTIDQIKDPRVAKRLERTLNKLLRAGALTREDHKDLVEEVRGVRNDIRDEAKAARRAAKARALGPHPAAPLIRG